MKKSSLDALTGAGFFAAFYVLINHVFAYSLGWVPETVKSWAWPLMNIVDRGTVAVNFFFVLSGFILAYNYSSPQGKMICSKRTFWVARFARIWPMYVVGLLLAIPLILHLGFAQNTGSDLVRFLTKQFYHVLGNLVLLNAWILKLNDVNAPGWSLSTEAFFYLLFPFALRPLGWLSNRALFFVAVALYVLSLLPPVLICAGHSAFTTNLYEAEKGNFPPIWLTLDTLYCFPPFRLPDFLIGVSLGIVFNRINLPSPRGVKGLSGHAGLALVAFVAALAFTVVVPWPILRNGFYTPFSAWLIWALARNKEGMIASFLAWSPLVLLGEASYGIYLFHLTIFHYSMFFLYRFYHIGMWSAEIILFSMTILIVIPLSILLFGTVEEPSRKFLRKRLSGESKSRRLAPAVGPLDVMSSS